MMAPDDPTRRRAFGPDFLTELFGNPLDPGYAEAAERRARRGPPTGWPARAVRAATVVTLLLLGVLLAVAYRQTVAEEPTRTKARDALVDQIQRGRSRTDLMQSRVDDLRARVAELRERELGRPAAERLRNLEADTGLARVRGDGAVLTLGDGDATIDPVTGERSTLGRVQDRDLQLAANALWAAGAEAIAINGQRLTATSTIRLAGEAILIDIQPVTSPYEIAAIGPDDLADRFDRSYAARVFRQLASEVGMSFDVRDADDLVLAAATEPQLRFAAPSASPTPSGSGPRSGPGAISTGGQPPPVNASVPVSSDPSSTPPEGGR